MLEAISELSGGQLAGWAACIIAALATIVQVSPIKINPWSWAAKKIGRAINGEIIDKVDKLEKKIEDQDATREEDKAESNRTLILRFGDEVRRGAKHSKEHFDQTMRIIAKYNQYCDTHPRFENGVTHSTAEVIEEAYRKALREDGFL